MKRFVLLVVILLIGFYVGWPAWSGYTIRSALQSRNAVALGAKIDLPAVRASMRPFVTQRVVEAFGRYQAQAGATTGSIMGQLGQQAIPPVVEAMLNILLTPQMLTRIAADGGTVKESFDRIMREQLGRGMPGMAGGGDSRQAGLRELLGKVVKSPGSQSRPVDAEPPSAPGPQGQVLGKREFSLSNVKSFSLNGPLSFRVGVAKEAGATEADVTAEMSFTGADWKITGLVPRG